MKGALRGAMRPVIGAVMRRSVHTPASGAKPRQMNMSAPRTSEAADPDPAISGGVVMSAGKKLAALREQLGQDEKTLDDFLGNAGKEEQVGRTSHAPHNSLLAPAGRRACAAQNPRRRSAQRDESTCDVEPTARCCRAHCFAIVSALFPIRRRRGISGETFDPHGTESRTNRCILQVSRDEEMHRSVLGQLKPDYVKADGSFARLR